MGMHEYFGPVLCLMQSCYHFRNASVVFEVKSPVKIEAHDSKEGQDSSRLDCYRIIMIPVEHGERQRGHVF
jgi:hypothetical protein